MAFFRENPELLVPFREGQRAVLELVYRAHVRTMERYLRALARASGTQTMQATTIADVLQEVFIRTFSESTRRTYDVSRPFTPYVKTITRNCFIDLLRSRGREVPTSTEVLLSAVDETSFEPSETFDPQIRAILSDYLAGLPLRLKGIYEQRFVLGQSQDAASSALGLSRRELRTGEEHLKSGLRKALVLAGVHRERPHPPSLTKVFGTSNG